jgi:hypothetical protein
MELAAARRAVVEVVEVHRENRLARVRRALNVCEASIARRPRRACSTREQARHARARWAWDERQMATDVSQDLGREAT